MQGTVVIRSVWRHVAQDLLQLVVAGRTLVGTDVTYVLELAPLPCLGLVKAKAWKGRPFI